METVYSAELRHERDPGEILDRDDDEGMMRKQAIDWLCVWSGPEHLCVNVSRLLGNHGRGEVHTQLSHSFQLLSATGDYYCIHVIYSVHVYVCLPVSKCLLDTGVPANNNAQVKWTREDSELSVLTELQAGLEQFKAELHGGRTDHVSPRWQFLSTLQHQVKALLKKGLPSSFQAKAHYQVHEYHLICLLFLHKDTRLCFYIVLLPVS